jgi:hypothetical protein
MSAETEEVVQGNALLGPGNICVAEPVVETGSHGTVLSIAGELGMTTTESVVADSGDKVGYCGNAMALGVEDDDATQLALADGLISVDTDGRAEALKGAVVRAVRALRVRAEGVAGKEVNEVT